MSKRTATIDRTPVSAREVLDCQIAAIPNLSAEQMQTLWAHNARIRGIVK